MKKFFALLMVGALILSCAGAALADDGHVPTPEVKTPDIEESLSKLSDDEKKVAQEAIATILMASENETMKKLGADLANATVLSNEEIVAAVNTIAQSRADELGVSVTEVLASTGRELTGSPIALGEFNFRGYTKPVATFLECVLDGNVGDLITFFSNRKDSGGVKVYIVAVEDDNDAVFLNSDGEMTDKVPADKKVTVVAVFEGGYTYEPLVVTSKEETSKKSGGSSGCAAGFGTLALMAVAFLGAKKFF